ncbi:MULTISPECIES: hypothetical protein [unclassified Anabaena]|uniref:hypothetical protein n=1 Tax=unclassified Anabaena TaxID=2619674 RepID=UPI00144564C1|nr:MULTISPECIES: hypothetical protein [unclassified Anabaena]MTJ08132.1 hypothetical protein [Anabaena sp. UHCC 0204]MTJ53144.1 hypothetical protein [Anabaena sp. UHCC 0253]
MTSSSEAGKAHAGAEIQSSLEPISDLSAIAGYSVPLNILSSETKSNDLLKLATQILENPQMQIQLGNRVYQLLQEDLRHQRERRIG